MNSPSMKVVRWAQAQFPAIHPGGVVDTAPLMLPPRPLALARLTP
jgi:nitrous oxidase accessory protein